MSAVRRTIVAIGGGNGWWTAAEPQAIDAHILALSRAPHDTRICLVPTAGADDDRRIADFYAAFSARGCRPAVLRLFERTVADIDAFLLEQDVVYVGGGNTASMLAVWRAHGVDRALRRAWEAGVVLCGVSAGMNCWFESCTTDSFNLGKLAPLHDGLALLEGSACPHYDGEPQRRPLYLKLVADAALPAGLAADNDAALVFEGTELAEAISTRRDAHAYRVHRDASGQAREQQLPTRYLG